MTETALFLRNVELDGAVTDVSMECGIISGIGGAAPKGAQHLDARGGALIPGLIDHHIHLFATAAKLCSIDFSDAESKDALIGALRAAKAALPSGEWLRATGYDDSQMGLLSRDDLDQAGGGNPIRVQDRTGALWVLNSAALDRVLESAPPSCVELDANGRVTGRIWRGDAWLRNRIQAGPPSLAKLSRDLAAFGITGVTDTGANNGPDEARLLARARASGELLQSLTLMSGGDIPSSEFYETGPIKILPDERDLPELDFVVERMRLARGMNRAIAVHCVTAAELALTLAAFEVVGAQNGDRLEHGGMIPEGLLSTIRDMNLTVVTQPHFIAERGDRYLRSIDAHELPDLYRLRSLREAGIKTAAGSDAPYGGINPWRAIASATARTTADGKSLGGEERIAARDALGLYLGAANDPGGAERKIEVGAPANLCLLRAPLSDALAALESVEVAATIAHGEIIYRAD